MPNLNQNNVSIVLAIIAIMPPILSFVYSSTLTEPIITIESEKLEGIQTLTIKNIGNTKATNMTAIIIGDKPIPKLNSVFSTVEIKSIYINNTQLKIQIPKFNHGEGSLIQMKMPIPSSNSVFDGYSAYFTYDQGSSKYDKYQIFIWIIVTYGIELPIAIIIGSLFRRRRIVSRTVKRLLDIRLEIIQDIENNTSKEIKIDPKLEQYYKKLAYQNFSMLQEYLVLNDFIIHLNKRNKAIQEKKLDQKENHLCLRELDKMLNNTNWSKHTSLLTIIRSRFYKEPTLQSQPISNKS